jgi:hypothetical protein
MDSSILPNSTKTPTKVLFPSSRLLNSNQPPENSLFLKFTCKEWENLQNPISSSSNAMVNDPTNVYAGMTPLIATIIIPAPKQIVSSTSVKYVDDSNAVQGVINTASSVGGFLTDLALTLLPGPWSLAGAASLLGGDVRKAFTGRRDLDATDSMFDSAEKRVYQINFTLVATTTEEARDVARISNMFHALALPQKAASFSVNVLTPYADKAFPPPLWRFGIGTGVNGTIDPSWLGQTSYTVLKSVSVNSAAGGSPYMIEDTLEKTNPKPLMTSFSLTFLDYEPVYRSEDSYKVIPRSATGVSSQQ